VLIDQYFGFAGDPLPIREKTLQTARNPANDNLLTPYIPGKGIVEKM